MTIILSLLTIAAPLWVTAWYTYRQTVEFREKSARAEADNAQFAHDHNAMTQVFLRKNAEYIEPDA